MSEEVIWKPVMGHEGRYEVSNTGLVRSLRDKYGREQTYVLKNCNDTYGYPQILLYQDKKRYTIKVHRLVAQAFLENPQNKPTVNHINGNKEDNRVVNLEWATYSENSQHAFDTGLNIHRPNWGIGELKANSKKVRQFTLKGEMIREFDSIAETEAFGFNHKTLYTYLNRGQNIYRGYRWEYGDQKQQKKQRKPSRRNYKGKPVNQLSLDGRFIKRWAKINLLVGEGFSSTAIIGCCRGRQKYHHGFRWEYAD